MADLDVRRRIGSCVVVSDLSEHSREEPGIPLGGGESRIRAELTQPRHVKNVSPRSQYVSASSGSVSKRHIKTSERPMGGETGYVRAVNRV